MDPLIELARLGQSFWLDKLSRDMIASGELARWMSECGLRGVTSNPKIFHDAIAASDAYEADIASAVAEGLDTPAIYERLATTDVRNACDVLRPVYDETDGADGFVSLEVSPHLAHDGPDSVAEAHRLWDAVARPNLMIKIPGTLEGLDAIEELLYDGINVNITLLFAVERYQAVALRYIQAMERRVTDRRPVDRVASVASFFLSRIDVLVDQLLSHRLGARTGSGAPDPRMLMGRAAIANARLAYRQYQELFRGERWDRLARAGARVQRLLWASTSTKNPDYRDVMYVEPLIGKETVNTMPVATAHAFADHGQLAPDTIEQGREESVGIPLGLRRLGIELDQVTAQLENEGVQKFIDPFDDLMASIDARRRRLASRRDVGPVTEVARKLRRKVIEMTTAARSGHPTSCMSAADIVAALFFHEMRWDPSDPEARNVDQFVLSKGHAAPLLWAALAEAGAIDEDPMTLRRIDSTLEGHPTPNNPWVRVATGSLGQGLAAANGLALANRLDGIDARVFCLLGDGECAEGSVWEAAQFAALNKLKNLIAIVDVNALGQSQATPYRHHTEIYAGRFAAFGWKTLTVDGHDVAAIFDAFAAAALNDAPTAIVARTEKGRGVSFLEGRDGWHGKALDEKEARMALEELGGAGAKTPKVAARRVGAYARPQRSATVDIMPDYKIGDRVATRDGYGAALDKIGQAMPDIVVLDGDVKNSTRAASFAKHFPDRFFESYIAEQNMVGTAMGLAASGKIPYASTFACFLSRAADFVRMAGHSRLHHLVLCGSHAGVSIGEDGPSQMGLEDIAIFRAVLGSTVLYPSDAVSAERLTACAAATDGIVYIRTTRPETPVIYPNDERFEVGGSKTLRSSDKDRLTVVAAGITVHEALAAHDALRSDGVNVRVIDAYSVKPLDVATLEEAGRATGGLLVVEDHFAEGGLGEAVAAAVDGGVPMHRLAVTAPPRSGPGPELMDLLGISRGAIARKVRELAG